MRKQRICRRKSHGSESPDLRQQGHGFDSDVCVCGFGIGAKHGDRFHAVPTKAKGHWTLRWIKRPDSLVNTSTMRVFRHPLGSHVFDFQGNQRTNHPQSLGMPVLSDEANVADRGFIRAIGRFDLTALVITGVVSSAIFGLHAGPAIAMLAIAFCLWLLTTR